MRYRMLWALFAVCAAGGSIASGLKADATDKEKQLKASLVGTWKLVSAKYGDRVSDLPHDRVTLKHVTPDGFVFLSYGKNTGTMSRSGGGYYTLKGETYTETVQYGLGDDFEVIKNVSHSFTCRIEGDKWQHDGKLANGLAIAEVWERVKGKGEESLK